MQQGGHEERTLFRICIDNLKVVAAAIHDLSFVREFCDTIANFITSLLPGLPMRILPSATDNASMTSPAIAAGAMTRRIAVHFWPALLVISFATSLM